MTYNCYEDETWGGYSVFNDPRVNSLPVDILVRMDADRVYFEERLAAMGYSGNTAISQIIADNVTTPELLQNAIENTSSENEIFKSFNMREPFTPSDSVLKKSSVMMLLPVVIIIGVLYAIYFILKGR